MKFWKGNKADAESVWPVTAVADAFMTHYWRENLQHAPLPLERMLRDWLTAEDGFNSVWEAETGPDSFAELYAQVRERAMAGPSEPELTDDELKFLLSYADGPRIWDAASLLPDVMRLQARGLIVPDPERSPAQRLTEKGRQVLATAYPPIRLKDGREAKPMHYIQKHRALYKVSTLYPAENRMTVQVCFGTDGEPMSRDTVRQLTRGEAALWYPASTKIINRYHDYLDRGGS